MKPTKSFKLRGLRRSAKGTAEAEAGSGTVVAEAGSGSRSFLESLLGVAPSQEQWEMMVFMEIPEA